MSSTVETPGTALASELQTLAEEGGRRTPMDAVLDTAIRGELTDEQRFRLLGRLWTLKRSMYYVYGSWALGLNVNEFPPTVAYLFGKQIYDDSTHEMQYIDEILRRRWSQTQREAFRHPNCVFTPASRLAYFIFALRALTNYRQNIRIASLNLGAKVIELGWLERFGQAFPDGRLRGVFAGQVAETRSHVLMGRLIVERYVTTSVDAGLCRIDHGVVRQNYLFALDEIATFTLGLAEQAGEITVPRHVD